MEEYDRIFVDELTENDVIRYADSDIEITHFDDRGAFMYVTGNNLDTGDVEFLELHWDLRVALVTY